MQSRVRWIVLVVCVGWSATIAGAIVQTEERLVLAPEASGALLDTGLTITFETVVEDSRCPIGVTCVWAGDAVVRIRIDGPKIEARVYTLHTSERSTREIWHGDVRVRLLALAPQPTTDGPPRAADYRATLGLQRKN